jgi:SPP1 family predicted phage head-tail adaptor
MACKPRAPHLATIQQKSSDQDSTGQPIETWVDVGTWWVTIEPLRGRELFAAQQVNAETTTRITGHYRSDVTADMRIQYLGVNYNIQSIIDTDLRHAELIIIASSGLNDG